MKRKVWITMTLLLTIAMITGYLHSSDLDGHKESQEQAIVTLMTEELEVSMDMDSIRDIGEETFHATIHSSSQPTSEHTYTGVALKGLLVAAGIEIEEDNQILVRAVDGYAVALTGREVLDEENVYLVYLEDGELLSTKDQGGSGPYMLVITKDPFSQRWCKFVMRVEIQ